jgi:hypothetical protein
MQHPLYTFRSKDRIQKKERRKKEKEEKEKEKEKEKRTGKPVPIGPLFPPGSCTRKLLAVSVRDEVRFTSSSSSAITGHVWRLLEWNFFPNSIWISSGWIRLDL